MIRQAYEEIKRLKLLDPISIEIPKEIKAITSELQAIGFYIVAGTYFSLELVKELKDAYIQLGIYKEHGYEKWYYHYYKIDDDVFDTNDEAIDGSGFKELKEKLDEKLSVEELEALSFLGE